MAAADMATVAGTRRAVIRSERFMQWQRELSSTRRAPYGSRKRFDDGKSDGTETLSEDVRGRKDLQGPEEQPEEAGDGHVNNATGRVKRHRQQQQQQQSPDCKKLEREIGPPHQPETKVLSSNADAGLSNEQQEQRGQQSSKQNASPAPPARRRRQRSQNKNQEVQPSRRCVGGDTNAAMDVPNSQMSKRPTRLLARKLGVEVPVPPPLKLPKLHVVLSRKEVQEDWLKMTGQRYSGKPRKSALVHLGLGLCTSLTCPSSIRYLNDP